MSKFCKWNDEFGTGGTLKCTCDECKQEVNYTFKKYPDYKGSQEKLKKKGWFPRKLGDKWYDFCSDKCFDTFRNEPKKPD